MKGIFIKNFNFLDEVKIKRRQFIQKLCLWFFGGYFFSGCASMFKGSSKIQENRDGKSLFFSDEEFNTLGAVQNCILPGGVSSPDAQAIGAMTYLERFFSYPDFKDQYFIFIQDGLNRLNKNALRKKNKNFYALDVEDRENLLLEFEKEGFNRDWLMFVIALTVEALLSDPIYGGNKNEMGWKWLEYSPKFPRPTKPYAGSMNGV
ncbi:MAG: gluconate 2-dehydrogenase subunit 3 family protein [Bdellovibrionota bacterium]